MSTSSGTRETRHHALEIKFAVERPLAAEIHQWALTRLSPDPYGTGPHGDRYTTSSIYVDTDEQHVFHRIGSFARAKYRVRRYGRNDFVFLERKLRTSGLLAKRRTIIHSHELKHLSRRRRASWAGSWFEDRLALRRLLPICQVTYDRVARVGENAAGPFRLTIDENLRVARTRIFDFSDGAGEHLLHELAIVEVKYRTALPGLFKELVERFRLRPARISKYRVAWAALNQLPLPEGIPAVAPATAVHARRVILWGQCSPQPEDSLADVAPRVS